MPPSAGTASSRTRSACSSARNLPAKEPRALPMPPQIILFLENLWDFAEADEEVSGEEVHTTYLHELGHYLGLDEDDLFDRGLE